MSLVRIPHYRVQRRGYAATRMNGRFAKISASAKPHRRQAALRPSRSAWQDAVLRKLQCFDTYRTISECSISVPSRRTRLLSKCSDGISRKQLGFNILQEIHQIGGVMRSGEYRTKRTDFEAAAGMAVFSLARKPL